MPATIVPADSDRLTKRDRLVRRDLAVDAFDAVRDAAERGRLDWSLFPETGGNVRANLQAGDAKAAFRTLAVAAGLVLVRATILPWAIAGYVAELPGRQRAMFAEYLDPTAITAALGLAAALFACAILAARRPLSAATLATAVFLAATVPFVWANPTTDLIPHVGRLVTFLLILKALAVGMSYRAR